jgi:hypothetical protein
VAQSSSRNVAIAVAQIQSRLDAIEAKLNDMTTSRRELWTKVVAAVTTALVGSIVGFVTGHFR